VAAWDAAVSPAGRSPSHCSQRGRAAVAGAAGRHVLAIPDLLPAGAGFAAREWTSPAKPSRLSCHHRGGDSVICCRNAHGEPDFVLTEHKATRARIDSGDLFDEVRGRLEDDDFTAPFLHFLPGDRPQGLHAFAKDYLGVEGDPALDLLERLFHGIVGHAADCAVRQHPAAECTCIRQDIARVLADRGRQV
jgi:hypothetical protein